MLAVAHSEEDAWLPIELGAVLRHPLAAPIRSELLQGASEDGAIKTFNDLFRHPNPPLELLRQVKDFAKANREHPNSPLPPDVATVLYYASIAVALTRGGERITNLEDTALKQGFEWVLTQGWMQELFLLALFRSALSAFGQFY